MIAQKVTISSKNMREMLGQKCRDLGEIEKFGNLTGGKDLTNSPSVASVLLLLCTNLMLLLLASKVPVGSSDQAMPLEGCSWLMNLQKNQSSVFHSETTCRVRPQTGAGMAVPRCQAPSSPAASFSSQLSLHRLPHLLPPGAL